MPSVDADNRILYIKSMTFEDWGLIPYATAYERQLSLVAERISDKISDTVVFVEHPAVYTLGVRPEAEAHLTANEAFLKKNKIEVIHTNRGGDITHHAPGQLVIYPIIKLGHKDLHRYLRDLEEVIIRALGNLGLASTRVKDKTGVWVAHGAQGKDHKKIAAIGVAVKQWVTYHGAALNVTNDLSLFDGIVPCGLKDCQVTSLKEELKQNTPTMAEVKDAVQDVWTEMMLSSQ